MHHKIQLSISSDWPFVRYSGNIYIFPVRLSIFFSKERNIPCPLYKPLKLITKKKNPLRNHMEELKFDYYILQEWLYTCLCLRFKIYKTASKYYNSTMQLYREHVPFLFISLQSVRRPDTESINASKIIISNWHGLSYLRKILQDAYNQSCAVLEFHKNKNEKFEVTERCASPDMVESYHWFVICSSVFKPKL